MLRKLERYRKDRNNCRTKIAELKYILKKKEQGVVDEQKKSEMFKALLGEQELEIEGLKEHIRKMDRGVNIKDLLNSKKVKRVRGGKKSAASSKNSDDSGYPEPLRQEARQINT